jgi:hypothetical protein
MALLNNRQSDSKLVFLSPRSKVKGEDGKTVELEKPHFEISRVNEEGKIVQTTETCSKVTGDLTKIEFKSREIKGVSSRHVILYISDADTKETYYLDLSMRISTRALMNAMLNLTSAKNIGVSLYRSKKGYESFGLEQDGVSVKWKFELKDLPEADVIKDKKGVVVKTDFSEVDAFMETELKAVAERLFGPESTKASAPANTAANTQPTTAAKVEVKEESKDSDIPF